MFFSLVDSNTNTLPLSLLIVWVLVNAPTSSATATATAKPAIDLVPHTTAAKEKEECTKHQVKGEKHKRNEVQVVSC